MHDGLDNTYYNCSIFSEGEGDRPIQRYSQMQLSIGEKILYSIAEILASIFAASLVGVPFGVACMAPTETATGELNFTPFWVCYGISLIVSFVISIPQLKEIWGQTKTD